MSVVVEKNRFSRVETDVLLNILQNGENNRGEEEYGSANGSLILKPFNY